MNQVQNLTDKERSKERNLLLSQSRKSDKNGEKILILLPQYLKKMEFESALKIIHLISY